MNKKNSETDGQDFSLQEKKQYGKWGEGGKEKYIWEAEEWGKKTSL